MSAAPRVPALGREWIKVCGVRSDADLALCAAAGASHVGINVHPLSPRAVSILLAVRLARAASGAGLVPVLVVGGVLPEETVLAAFAGGFVQLLEAPSPATRAGLATLAVGVVEARRVTAANAAASTWGDALLADVHVTGRPGGTGVRLDPAQARLVPAPFVLAGGLHPDTVADAIAAIAPAGVDAASGLKSAPGVKDEALVRAFCAAARAAFAAYGLDQEVRDVI